jgi:hypothetical protein
MKWLERHAWWGLLFITLLFVAFGVGDIIVGPAADVGIPVGLTGMTPDELEAESAAAYRLFDFFTRVNGASLALSGLFATAILLFGFRRNQRWAWWTLWLVPVWATGVLVSYLIAGVQPDQPPPPPMISGPILAVLAAAILLVSAPRFFRSPSERGSLV